RISLRRLVHCDDFLQWRPEIESILGVPRQHSTYGHDSDVGSLANNISNQNALMVIRYRMAQSVIFGMFQAYTTFVLVAYGNSLRRAKSGCA
ncbi:hypothetical protein PENTCL1PPCAC_132, partial [Pristionchus entomophagus]